MMDMQPTPPKYRDRLLAAAYRMVDAKDGESDGSLEFLSEADAIIEAIEADCEADHARL